MRDSAGIMIYESSGPRWAAGDDGWKIEDAPEVDLSSTGQGPAHEFLEVSDVSTLPDGRIVVATAHEIRFFSHWGMFLASVGREGEGPGEFRSGPRIDVLGDSVAAFDFRLSRVTVYGPDLDPPAVVTVEGGPFERDFVARRSGLILMKVDHAYRERPPGLTRAPVAIVLVSRKGGIIDTLALAAGTEMVTIPTDRGVLLEAPPFGRKSHFAAHAGRLVVGDASALAFRIIDLDGSGERRVRGVQDLILSAGEIDAERDALLGDRPSTAMRRLLDDIMDQVPTPYRRPAYRRLEVDGTGAVWLEAYVGEAGADAPVPWEVFSPAGEWLGRVVVPARFEVFEIGRDYVLGVRRDALDVEHVQKLALRRTDGSGP